MKSAARLISACIDGVDARFVFSGSKRRSLEAETVQLIFGAACGQHVRARKISRGRGNEMPVDVKLHFDTTSGRRFIDGPTVNMCRCSFVECAAKEGVEGCQVESDGERSDEQRFED